MRAIPPIAALVTLVVHLIGNPHYGFYRDELYFIVCGFHPAWGYVDQPPLVPLLAAGSQLLGHSLFAVRALAALFAAAGVYVTCLFVIEIGGGTFAVLLAALLTALTPVLAAFGTKVSTDMPGLLLWPLAALMVARIVNGACPRLWLVAGLALGLAAEAKYSVLFFGAALIVGIALSPSRRILATPWLLVGLALGLVVALPNVAWQAANGWPMLAMLQNQQLYVVVQHSPADAVLQQVLVTNPFLALFWIAGLIYAFVNPRLRWIGWTYVLFVVPFILLHGRNYYPGDVYPLVIAAGAVAVERLPIPRFGRIAIVAATVAASIPAIPFILPVLPESTLANIVTGGQRRVSLNLAPARNADSPITSNFADMHGWPELTAAVAGVYDSLPPAERSHAAILAANFGEAAAIDFYGSAYGLPPALSGNNNYWIWGPRGYDGGVVVEVNGTCAEPNLFRVRSARVATFHSAWAMPAEDGIPISICAQPSQSLSAYWPRLRDYI